MRLPLLLAAALIVLACFSTPTVALTQDASFANDIVALNFALTLERLEAAFYTSGQAQFNAANFTAAGYDNGVYEYFGVIKAHEVAHVQALVDTIESMGGVAVPACNYTLTAVTSVESYVATALLLESTGVSAYDGAINAISDPSLQQVAATIATIEARHTAYILNLRSNARNATSPFPAGVDTALTPAAVLAAAAPFFAGCSFPFSAVTPTVRPRGVGTPNNLTNAAPTSTARVSNAYYTQAAFDNDLVALNYALVLENLEAGFYAAGQARFNRSDWVAAYPTQGDLYYNNFVMIAAHEAAHVDALKTIITGRGGVPVAPCTYDFSATKIPALADYITVAQTLENTGVSAYDGAVNAFTDTGLQQIAATIATVEARHAAFLNSIKATPAAGTAAQSFDTALTPAAIVAAVTATGLQSACPAFKLPTIAPSLSAQSNDINALNYALTLEKLEAAFYAFGQNAFTSDMFVSAGLTASAYVEFARIASQEAAHVAALTSTIVALGGTPVPACTYNFASVVDVRGYLAASLLLENTGVSAYTGAINTITSPDLQQTAATIATVEARHVAYLLSLNNSLPFPTVTDSPLQPATVVQAAAAFFTSCPYSLSLLPFVRPSGTANGRPSSPAPTPATFYSRAQRDNDIVALNYALILEQLEAAFYNDGASRFTEAQFQTAYGSVNGSQYFNYLKTIQSHENEHVASLTSVIRARGGNPVAPCTYAFGTITTVQAFLATASVLESTGVSAYDGAVNLIADTDLQQVAATIATVEARHAAYLNVVLGKLAFPDVVDTALPPATILAAVSATGLISSCPVPPVGPVAVPVIDSTVNDITALQYALYLERLEAAFYTYGVKTFPTLFGSTGSGPQMTLLYQHELAHVKALANTIQSLGGQPNPACVYDFSSITTAGGFLGTASTLEELGVSAYDGAINAITDAGLQQVAASIATVEARHAAFLLQDGDQRPFPREIDLARTPEDVRGRVAATLFVRTCPFQLVLPDIRAGGVQLNLTTLTPYPSSKRPQSNAVYTQAQQTNDIRTLNYALQLENLEAAFYNQLGSGAFVSSAFSSYPSGTYAQLQLIQAHENAHVTALRNTITARGGTPVSPCTYNFASVTSAAEFVNLAAALELIGVQAYDGAVSSFTDTNLLEVAATIATVEARHAAYLNILNGRLGAPDTFDKPKDGEEILALVTAAGFLGQCPNQPLAPRVIPGPQPIAPVPYDPSSTATQSSTGGPAQASTGGAAPAASTSAPASNTGAPAAASSSTGASNTGTPAQTATPTPTPSTSTAGSASTGGAAASTGGAAASTGAPAAMSSTGAAASGGASGGATGMTGPAAGNLDGNAGARIGAQPLILALAALLALVAAL